MQRSYDMCCMKQRLKSVKVCGTFTVLYLFLLEVENEAHSPRAKPRQRPQDLSWRWKLVEHPDCLHGLPSRPQRRNDTNFTLRSLLETLIHKDNHCQPPFHLLREPCSTIKSIQGFFKRKKAHENASRPWVSWAAFLPRLRRALPRASRLHTCNLLARTVTWLLLPAPSPGSGCSTAVSIPEGTCGRVPSLFLASCLFLFSSSFYLTVQKDQSCLLLFFLNLNFFNLHFLVLIFLYILLVMSLSKIERSGRVWNKNEMKRSLLLLRDILSAKGLLGELPVIIVACLCKVSDRAK